MVNYFRQNCRYKEPDGRGLRFNPLPPKPCYLKSGNEAIGHAESTSEHLGVEGMSSMCYDQVGFFIDFTHIFWLLFAGFSLFHWVLKIALYFHVSYKSEDK